MLVIRNHQMEVFAREARTRFEAELTVLFLATYPREARQAGGMEQFGRVLGSSIKRALSLGFTSEKQVTLFVGLTLMLGHDFHADPQLPWAWQITAPGNKSILIDAVYDAAVAYLTATAGQDSEYVVRALLRIRDYNLYEAPESEGEAFVEDVLQLLLKFCPEKYAYQGGDLNRKLIAYGQQTARGYGITDNRGVLLLTTLMFMLGSGVDHDPLHPWASAALHDPAAPDQSTRIDLLYRAAMAHMAESLQPDDAQAIPVLKP